MNKNAMCKVKHGSTIRWAASVLLIAVLVFFLPAAATAQFDTVAESAILMEAATGRILYQKNADIPLPPASITKIMTLLIGFEALERGDADWDDLITVSERAWQKEGSTMFLEVGKQVSYGDVITGISVVSANDGCVALAEHLYGSEEAFVQVMNQRAAEIGLASTQFKNSTGLPDEGHWMSAEDIAILSRYLITRFPQILEIESQREFTYEGMIAQGLDPQLNRNPLLGTFPGADGLKTGWTTEAGYCLVGTAEQHNLRLISVVLRTESNQERLTASSELLTYGFTNYEASILYKTGDVVGEIEVRNGTELTVPVKALTDVVAVVPVAEKDNITTAILYNQESIDAPFAADVVVGTLSVTLDGEVLAIVEVATAEEMERAGFFAVLWRSITNFFRSLFQVERQ